MQLLIYYNDRWNACPWYILRIIPILLFFSCSSRLSSEPLREVETKDIQVRLQELFRDRKNALEETQTHMVAHYQNRLQETSSEITNLDTSIAEKKAAIEKLQEEIVTLTVRKELLSSGMDKISNRHGEQLEQIGCQRTEIADKMNEYAVTAPPMKVTRLVIYAPCPCPCRTTTTME